MFLFEDEPGKQVRSAIRIKNIRKSHAAFKVHVNFLLYLIHVALQVYNELI